MTHHDISYLNTKFDINLDSSAMFINRHNSLETVKTSVTFD